MFVDEGLDIGEHCYTVTGVYDLSPYGPEWTGQTGESMEEGPECVTVQYCYPLDFMETWDLGNFESKEWMAGDNWRVNGQLGNPAPAAEFTWDPLLAEYESALTSQPLCATDLTEGDIWLDYDIMLDAVNSDSTEFMHVQVWNWTAQEWVTVMAYDNDNGDIPWTSEHLNISDYAMGENFRIRFHAAGLSTLNILSWMVDNIHVYRVCAAPTNLTSDVVEDDIVLNWENPGPGPIAEWIQWCLEDVTWGIGTGGEFIVDVAARWDPPLLGDYEGASVTQVAFFPLEESATYNVRVWTGGDLTGPANMVVDQPVLTPVIGSWNIVVLDTPVPIDVTQDLWVGYYINATTGNPAGADEGPEVDGYGNMINFGGWTTLLEVGADLTYNWNIKAYVETVVGATMPLSQEVESTNVPEGLTLRANTPDNVTNPYFMESDGNRDLTGVNIWRSVDGGDYEIIDFVAEPEMTYTDEDLVNGLYCYMVQAVYEGEGGDMCESAPSNETCEVLSVSISDPNASAEFNMYPNPAADYVFITSSKELKRVTVFNALGQLIVDEIVSGNEYELKTASFVNGMYMVRVENATGITTRALNVRK
jgi:hypothetical protein